MQAVTLQVADEIKALGDALIAEGADIAAKKGLPAEIADAMPALLSLAGSYQALPMDVKKAESIAYLGYCVAKAFLPGA